MTSMSLPMEAIPEEAIPEAGLGPEAPADQMPLPEEAADADDPNLEPDSDEEEPPPPQFDPTPSQLRDLKIAHDNAGHPTNVDVARLLRRGNAKPEVANWVRHHFRCEACESHKAPKARRPAAIPKSYRVNHVLGLDLVGIKNLQGENGFGSTVSTGDLDSN